MVLPFSAHNNKIQYWKYLRSVQVFKAPVMEACMYFMSL